MRYKFSMGGQGPSKPREGKADRDEEQGRTGKGAEGSRTRKGAEGKGGEGRSWRWDTHLMD
jgi:hypothetical protein